MKLTIFSKALYSTWVYYSPDRILFDAGEGVSSVLGNKAFAIKHVFLSHGHADHITGLIGFINIRNNAMGDTEKPLSIYYPEGNWRICELMVYLQKTVRRLKYALEWVPLVAGSKIPVFEGQNPRHVEAFETVHSGGEKCLGYNVIEERKRLKTEYQKLSQVEILKFIRQRGKEAVQETYAKKIFSYGGDSIPIEPAKIAGTEILCHDATFLNEADRQEYKHATLEEAIATAKAAGVEKELFAIHISSRYKHQIKQLEQKLNNERDLNFRVILVPPGKVVNYE